MSDAHAAIATLMAGHTAAWTGGDVDTIADVMGLPQMLAGSGGTTFIEDDGQLVVWIEERLAAWAAHGVARVTAAVEGVEELPDEAARVTTRWRLTDAAGAERLTFVAVDTLACDEGEWYFVVTDVAGEEAAWSAVN